MSLAMFADAVLKGTALLLVVFMLARALRNAPAAARHLVWAMGLAGLLIVPVLSRTMPWRLEILPATETTSLVEPSSMERSTAPNPIVSPHPAVGPEAVPFELPAEASRSAAASGVTSPAGVESQPAPGSGWTLPSVGTILFWLPIVWVVGAVLLLARLAVGAAGIQWIARRATPVRDATWSAALTRARQALGVAVPVRLVVSEHATIPFTAGVVRHVIVLPAASAEWDDARRHTVLLHELAHIKRRDVLAHVVSQTACALYWFHPLVCVTSKQLRAECERACDDRVLDTGTRPSDYAEHLLSIVRGAARRWTPAVALPMVRRSEFEGRLLAILESDGRLRSLSTRSAGIIVASVAFAVVPLAALAPGQDDQTEVTAQTPIYAALPAITNPDPGLKAPIAGPPEVELSQPQRQRDNASVQQRDAVAPPSPARPQQQRRPSLEGALIATLGDSDPEVRAAAARSLGSYQDTSVIRALAATLRDDENPTVRRTAAWALGKIENPLAIPALSSALTGDADPEVRAMAASALGEIDDPGAVGALGNAIANDAHPGVRYASIRALAEIEDPRAIPALTAALADSNPRLRRAAVRGLGDIDDARAIDALTGVLAGDPDIEVRKSAAWALGEIDDGRAVQPLSQALDDAAPEVRLVAIRALGEIEDARAVQPLIGLLTDGDTQVRKYAAAALGEIEDSRAVDPLVQVLRSDADASVRVAAARALAEIEDRRAAPALAAALTDASVEVRRRAARALGELDDLHQAPPELLRALQDADQEVRLRAIRAIGEIEDAAAVPALIPLLQSEITEQRRLVIRALSEMHAPAAYEVLVQALRDDDPEIRRLAARALGRR